jgi:hypothetical protein
MNHKTSIWCTLQLDGIHSWDDIPQDSLDDVQFLRNDHRHMFGFKCYARVDHSNRDLEFITLKRQIHHFLHQRYYDGWKKSLIFGSMSCEMIAEVLLTEFEFLYRVDVDEDRENGCIVERSKSQ